MRFVLMFLLFASCEHKELCYDHWKHAPSSNVGIVANYEREWQYTGIGGTDWANCSDFYERFGIRYDELRPALPEGLRMHIYKEDGTDEMLNLATHGEVVAMPLGEHSMLFYNNDTEYIVFDRMHSFASARATTRRRSRASYTGNPFMDAKREETANMPDMLYGNYMESYTVERKPKVEELSVGMHPLVFSYLVRYEFSHGLEYVALARGVLAGMAESVYMHDGHTSKETVSVLFDCSMESFGAQAVVRSFGVPDFPNEHYITKISGKYGLNLEVRLKNGKTKQFNFDVSEQVARQPQGGVIVVRGLEISDEEGEELGSGFGVEVDDWGEYEDVEIPL